MGKARKGGDRVKLTVVLDGATARRVKAYAGHHGTTVGKVVEEAVSNLMRGFSVTQRTGSGTGVQSPGSGVPGADLGPPDVLSLTRAG